MIGSNGSLAIQRLMNVGILSEWLPRPTFPAQNQKTTPSIIYLYLDINIVLFSVSSVYHSLCFMTISA